MDNIKNMTDLELKSLAFDEMQKIQLANNNYAIIVQELNDRTKSNLLKMVPKDKLKGENNV